MAIQTVIITTPSVDDSAFNTTPPLAGGDTIQYHDDRLYQNGQLLSGYTVAIDESGLLSIDGCPFLTPGGTYQIEAKVNTSPFTLAPVLVESCGGGGDMTEITTTYPINGVSQNVQGGGSFTLTLVGGDATYNSSGSIRGNSTNTEETDITIDTNGLDYIEMDVRSINNPNTQERLEAFNVLPDVISPLNAGMTLVPPLMSTDPAQLSDNDRGYLLRWNNPPSQITFKHRTNKLPTDGSGTDGVTITRVRAGHDAQSGITLGSPTGSSPANGVVNASINVSAAATVCAILLPSNAPTPTDQCALVDGSYPGALSFDRQVSSGGPVNFQFNGVSSGQYKVAFAIDHVCSPGVQESGAITVSAVNNPPVITPVTTPQLRDCDVETLDVAIVDPDGDNMSFSLNNAPAGVSITAITGGARVTFDNVPVGNYASLEIVADDGQAQSVLGIPINVTACPANTPPVIVAPGTIDATDCQAGSRMIAVTNTEGDPLSISLQQAPVGCTLTDTGSGLRFSWPSGLAQGSYQPIVNVDDGHNPVVSRQLQFVVRDCDTPPVLSPIPNQQGNDCTQVNIPLNVSDDHAGVTLTSAGLPLGVSIQNNAIVGTPAEGVYSPIISATDSAGQTEQQQFNWQVARCLDGTPDQFTIPAKFNQELNTNIMSVPVTPVGYSDPAQFSAGGCGISFDGGLTWHTTGTIQPGQSFIACVATGNEFNEEYSATVIIGGQPATFRATTKQADRTPNPFSFGTKANLELNSEAPSEPITLSGINAPVSVTVTGGMISINGQAPSTTAVYNPGDTLTAIANTASDFLTPRTVTVEVGGASGQFIAITKAPPTSGGSDDITPDPMVFPSLTNVAPDTEQCSAVQVVKGLSIPVPIAVSGGSVRVNGVLVEDMSAARVRNNDTIQMCHVSSEEYSEQAETTLVVGSGTFRWSTVTRPKPETAGGGTQSKCSGYVAPAMPAMNDETGPVLYLNLERPTNIITDSQGAMEIDGRLSQQMDTIKPGEVVVIRAPLNDEAEFVIGGRLKLELRAGDEMRIIV